MLKLCRLHSIVGLPKQLLNRLQSVQKAAARLISTARRRDHVQLLLRSLHWLPVPQRISFRLAVLVYRCLHGSAPGYLATELQNVSHLNARRRLRSSSTSALVAQCTLCAAIRRPRLPSGCRICLEQSAGDSTSSASWDSSMASLFKIWRSDG